ncbi:hypothetical protein CWE12_07385 [Aliidiomarina sedimenti]|uniref:Uncharacterized protein n=1 Tax=Aliidiomarina sedimenti TaxID=1933879 RepID=A0ABY0BYK9_9GAMM|nr:Dyp-type peroxidase domain-containing protein [Aliidiomarina sedimenti]RUO29787.1 hypothetical protein CWE12_07385 [Aliidiomarina sedimenti]
MKSQGQAGVANRGSIHGLVLLCQVQPAHLASLRLKLAKLPALAASLDERFSESLLTVTAAFGEDAFRQLGALAPAHRFSDLPSFEQSPASLNVTTVDIALIIRSERYDSCFFAGRVLTEWFAADVEMLADYNFFHYLDNRNLFGFKCWRDTLLGAERRNLLAMQAEHEPLWDQGSYLILQHQRIADQAWQQLKPEQQEQVIGRNKLSGEPILTDRPNHFSKVQEHLGQALLWHQMPIASMNEQSHLELLWSNTPESAHRWLAQRIEDDEDGFRDPILDYQDNLLSAAFFVPPLPWFEHLKSVF